MMQMYYAAVTVAEIHAVMCYVSRKLPTSASTDCGYFSEIGFKMET